MDRLASGVRSAGRRLLGYCGYWAEGLRTLFLGSPDECPSCGLPFEYDGQLFLCGRCQLGANVVEPPVCARCGKPIRADSARSGLCADCTARPRFFELARAVGVYEGAFKGWIHELKYSSRRALARPIGQLMAYRLWAEPRMADAQVLVPIPLHADKLRERGFNQALLLARVMGSILAKRVADQVLERVRSTRPQGSLSLEARYANLRGAFRVTKPREIAGKRVVLVDDLLTTGATCDEAARALLRAGARSVAVMVAACQ